MAPEDKKITIHQLEKLILDAHHLFGQIDSLSIEVDPFKMLELSLNFKNNIIKKTRDKLTINTSVGIVHFLLRQI